MSDDPIHPTPVSLLQRLRCPADQAQQAWSRFVRLYTPLLFAGARRFGLTGADAADLVQDVFVQVVRKLNLLYHMVTGQQPFIGPTRSDILVGSGCRD